MLRLGRAACAKKLHKVRQLSKIAAAWRGQHPGFGPHDQGHSHQYHGERGVGWSDYTPILKPLWKLNQRAEYLALCGKELGFARFRFAGDQAGDQLTLAVV